VLKAAEAMNPPPMILRNCLREIIVTTLNAPNARYQKDIINGGF